MNDTVRPSGERLSASSDLEEKLVTSSFAGTSIVPSGWPDGVISASQIREVTPKLPSTSALLKTWG
jgi:hypothetical protein